MKIVLLEPAEPDSHSLNKINRIHTILESSDHQVLRQSADKSLFACVGNQKPDVVFNLASTYSWGKTNLIPAMLEIAGVRYNGSGLFGLSLVRNYTKLFPLLLAAGVELKPFVITNARAAALPDGFHFPITIFRDGLRHKLVNQNRADLKQALKTLPASEDLVLQEKAAGEKVSIYILDSAPFLAAGDSEMLAPALKAYQLLEARGLARFDFVISSRVYLSKIDLSPDPLDEGFIRLAARQGFDEGKILQILLEHAGSDLPIPD
jgi:D-alanine-D-alanine ligase-like ATP-grasp enzyme